MKTVDATGTVVNGYTYNVYGKKTSSTGSQANEFDFAGQQTDSTGLQYLRARYYDPGTGTFVSRDPMAAAPSWGGHPFGYAGGNSVNRTDPTGLVQTDEGVGGQCRGWCWLENDDSQNTHALVWWEGFVYRAGDMPVVRQCWKLVSEKESESTECGPTMANQDSPTAAAISDARDTLARLVEIAIGVFRAESEVWNALQPFKGKTRTNGETGSDKRYYQWDRTHNNIEVYDSNRKHLGAMDPKTGEMVPNSRVPGRKIKLP